VLAEPVDGPLSVKVQGADQSSRETAAVVFQECVEVAGQVDQGGELLAGVLVGDGGLGA
jgi:hypothetical protein